MKQRIFTILSAVSLLLCVALVALWIVDYGGNPSDLRVRLVHIYGNWLAGVGSGGLEIETFHKPSQPTICPPTSAEFNRSYRPWALPGVRFDAFPSASGGAPRMLVAVLFVWHAQYWLVTLVTGVLPVVWLGHLAWRYLRARRYVFGLCRKCGYDLRASTERCPECGTPVPADLVRKPVA